MEKVWDVWIGDRMFNTFYFKVKCGKVTQLVLSPKKK